MPWPIRLLGLGPSCPFVTFAFKARLSPLITSTSTRRGRHLFVMSEAVVKGKLRPLRNPGR